MDRGHGLGLGRSAWRVHAAPRLFRPELLNKRRYFLFTRARWNLSNVAGLMTIATERSLRGEMNRERQPSAMRSRALRLGAFLLDRDRTVS